MAATTARIVPTLITAAHTKGATKLGERRPVLSRLCPILVRRPLRGMLGEPEPATRRRRAGTPEALRAHQKAEIEKWWPIIKEAGIKAE
jgi:hypothetical protein